MRAIVLVCTTALIAARYGLAQLPGVSPDSYFAGEKLQILAHKLTSERSKVPFDYYSLPFCHSGELPPGSRFNLAQVMMGERMRSTPYNVQMTADKTCEVLCTAEFPKRSIKKLRRLINDKYKMHLSLDGLFVLMRSSATSSRIGFPLGIVEQDKVYVYNHVQFTILYSKPGLMQTDDQEYQIVGFEAVPFSVKHPATTNKNDKLPTCKDMASQPPHEIIAEEPTNITFTYDVTFRESDLSWYNRWDAVTKSYPGRLQIQWFAIVNSSLLCVFLSTLIMLILLRTLRKDLFNSDLVGSDLDETGWKSLRRDVFRPPKDNVMLSVLAGTGVQLILIALVTLTLSLMGFISREYRGRLILATLILWVLTSSVAGYCAARVHAFMDGTRMRDVALGTAFFIPGTVFSVIFALNLLFWFTKSIGGTSVIAFIILLLLWFCLSVPLCYIGAQFGSHQKGSDPSLRYSSISREIPQQSIFFGTPMCIASGGLPFGVLSVELLFILNSLWQNEIYKMFGFLFFVFIIVLVVSAETSVVVTYVKLINEDHQWWWTAFFSSATTGLYVFLYSVYYLLRHDTLDGLNILSDIVVLGYMGIISLLVAVMIGAAGLIASLWFVNKIYSGLRAD
eukprot:Plantae.Rhodophyta-Purpureofilum_apyrenoidigerum.ctg2242.p1 GENE.Plantae.Rhodophyta-Purpureofilum_apyrenoidigerum.ctg2242~~Plantae.Rhodophyta-Purpureofilum_apyrenoidigerum.ctg2242.p1  ORF type:complete len:621 (-),score=107.66 Plantae.Rhodophyta-Purpureofilum_apyrenoidigerum.ctg2242:31-1893(-)